MPLKDINNNIPCEQLFVSVFIVYYLFEMLCTVWMTTSGKSSLLSSKNHNGNRL